MKRLFSSTKDVAKICCTLIGLGRCRDEIRD